MWPSHRDGLPVEEEGLVCFGTNEISFLLYLDLHVPTHGKPNRGFLPTVLEFHFAYPVNNIILFPARIPFFQLAGLS
jgi:hypothetical protein